MLNSLKAVCDCSESELLFNSIPVSQNQIQLSRLTSSFKNTNTATAKVLSNRVPPQTSGWHPSGYIHLSDCQWAKHGDTCHTCEYARVCLTSFSSLDCEWEGPCRCLHAFLFFVTEPLGVFTPIVCLLWSKSVDDFFLICSFSPCGVVCFHTEKNGIELQVNQHASPQTTFEYSVCWLARCVWDRSNKSKNRKKVLSSGLLEKTENFC